MIVHTPLSQQYQYDNAAFKNKKKRSAILKVAELSVAPNRNYS